MVASASRKDATSIKICEKTDIRYMIRNKKASIPYRSFFFVAGIRLELMTSGL